MTPENNGSQRTSLNESNCLSELKRNDLRSKNHKAIDSNGPQRTRLYDSDCLLELGRDDLESPNKKNLERQGTQDLEPSTTTISNTEKSTTWNARTAQFRLLIETW
jgi:hypothetical protein